MNIETIAKDKNITHMEAVLDYCYRNDIEPDSVGNLISKSLKEKIEANARELNFLPRQAQLPVWNTSRKTTLTILCTLLMRGWWLLF